MIPGRVIGIYSSIPRQGKSTIKDRLVEKHGFRHLAFARVIKRMVATFLIEQSYPEAAAWEYIENDKEVPLTRVAGMPTARYLLQTLGTEWGRNAIHHLVWTAEWELKAGAWSRSGIGIVADDLRFPNEVEAIKRLGGEIWRVERPDTEAEDSVIRHASEGGLSSLKFDRTFLNNGTRGALHLKVDRVIMQGRTGKRTPLTD